MDFGKVPLAELAQLDLSLPPDADETEQVLLANARPEGQLPEIYVGCPVWGKKEWAGQIYPAKAKEKDFLKYYARQFNAIELNATFYNQPSVKSVETWRSFATEGFRFFPKLTQQISQFKRLIEVEHLMESFMETLQLLGPHLEMCFLQLAHNYPARQIGGLRAFIDWLPKDYKLAIEFRHATWFSELESFYEIFDLMQERQIPSVITDTPGRRDVLHMRLTSPVAFVRFNANDLHATDFSRLDDWADRIKTWVDKGLHKAYFFVHTPDKSLNPVLSNYFIEKINGLCGLSLKQCLPIAEAEQLGLFQ